MKVRNLVGTSPNVCSCGSWLDHWSKLSRQIAYRCFVNGCASPHTVDGHVQISTGSDRNWYIVPLCIGCNNKQGQELDIWDGAALVSANVSETCGKT